MDAYTAQSVDPSQLIPMLRHLLEKRTPLNFSSDSTSYDLTRVLRQLARSAGANVEEALGESHIDAWTMMTTETRIRGAAHASKLSLISSRQDGRGEVAFTYFAAPNRRSLLARHVAWWHQAVSPSRDSGGPMGLLSDRPRDVDSPEGWDALLRLRRQARETGLRVTWTNGCFDLFHAGHAEFLRSAAALGEILVVGVNDDPSVTRLKGSGRPLMPYEARAATLLALRSVDVVVRLKEDAPLYEISALQPDAAVKDDSYLTLPLPERTLVERSGGLMILLPRLQGFSTSIIAAKLSQNT